MLSLRRSLALLVAALPLMGALARCVDDPGDDVIGGAPTCDARQAWVSGSVDGHDEEARGRPDGYSLAESALGNSLDFDVEGHGHVHVEWFGKAGEGREKIASTATYVSPTTGETYCANFARVVLFESGGQFELSGLRAGACPGTREVDGTIDGCFDDS